MLDLLDKVVGFIAEAKGNSNSLNLTCCEIYIRPDGLSH